MSPPRLSESGLRTGIEHGVGTVLGSSPGPQHNQDQQRRAQLHGQPSPYGVWCLPSPHGGDMVPWSGPQQNFQPSAEEATVAATQGLHQAATRVLRECILPSTVICYRWALLPASLSRSQVRHVKMVLLQQQTLSLPSPPPRAPPTSPKPTPPDLSLERFKGGLLQPRVPPVASQSSLSIQNPKE